MQATHEASVVNSSGRPLPATVTSVTPTRPPGRSTLANSAAAVALSGKVQNAHSHTRASNVLSGKGRRSASPRWNWAFPDSPAFSAVLRARSTVDSLRSTPSTVTSYSTASAHAVAPAPEAMSPTRCPQFADLFAVADGVVGAERDDPLVRGDLLYAALHQLLDVERVRVLEVLHHDHERPLVQLLHRLRQVDPAGGAFQLGGGDFEAAGGGVGAHE